MNMTKLTKIIISATSILLIFGFSALGYFGYHFVESSKESGQFTDINQVTGAYYFDNGTADSAQNLLTELKTITDNGKSKLNNLRPEIANVDDQGFIKFQDWLNPASIKEYKKYANDLIPTIKGDQGYPKGGVASWQLLVRTAEKRQMAINTINSLVISNNFDGIEIDFEPSFTTSPTVDSQPLKTADYEDMLTFLDDLSQVLSKQGKKLNIAIPAILPTPNTAQLYSYESILAKKGLIDRMNSITMMTYDLNYGNDYISTAPTEMLKGILEVAKTKLGAYQNKFAFGLNAYGTCKNQSTKEVVQLQKKDMKIRNGWNNLTQDPKLVDGWDDTFLSDGSVCAFPNSQTMRNRIKLAKSYGFNNFVVWSISGNNWIN